MSKISPLADRDKLIAAIEGAFSKKEVIEKLGLRSAGGNYKKLEKYADLYQLQLPDNRRPARKPTPLEEIFVKNSKYLSRNIIKKKMYSMGVKEECVECHLGPVWNNKPITLQLDHINGIHNDNRIENLAIICPNCHSQTATYAGVNKKNTTLPDRGPYYDASILTDYIEEQNTQAKISSLKLEEKEKRSLYRTDYPPIEEVIEMIEKTGYSATARSIGVTNNTLRNFVKKETSNEAIMPTGKYRKTRAISYPPIAELIEAIKEQGYTKIGKQLGTSDNAIRKHIRSHGYEPPRFHRREFTKNRDCLVEPTQQHSIEEDETHGNLR